MTEVEAIQTRIQELPPEDFSSLRKWFHNFENECWDKQIASDFKAGKFKKFIDKARSEFAQGKAIEI
ncbi:MAG: hypothetical protein AB7U45_13230 [Desulfamplus sp.]